MTVGHSRSTFLLGAATNWFAFAATLAVSFFLTPYLIASLGKPQYDVWCVVESVLAYFTLLDLGVAACLVRAIAGHTSKPDAEHVNRIATCCLAVLIAAGAVAFAVGTPVLWMLGERLEAKAGDPGDVLPFMLLMLLNLALTLPLSTFPCILDGLQRFTAKSVIRLIALAIRTVGFLIVVDRWHSLFPLAVVSLITNLLEHAAMAVLSFRYSPDLQLRMRFIDRETLRTVRTSSTDAFLALLAGRITVQTGAIVIGLMLPAGQVTFFATAARLVEYAKSLLRTITTTLMPGVAAMDARGDAAGIRSLYLKATRWLLYFVLPVQIGLLQFGAPFLKRWVGDDFVPEAYPTLVILSFTLTIGVAQSVASRVLYGLGRLRWFARAALGEAALNLLLMLFLIHPLGIEGVAVAVAVPNVLFCLFVLEYTRRHLGVSLATYLKAWLAPLMLSALPTAIWLALGEPEASWPGIVGGVLAGLIPFAIGVIAWEWRTLTFSRPAR